MQQIIDISQDGRHLSRRRGFLRVQVGDQDLQQIPFDQIEAVLVHAHGTTWSNSALVELADRGAPVVLCAANHMPRAVLYPIEGHNTQGQRMRAQWRAKAPLIKQAWKQIVDRKVFMQAAGLQAFGEDEQPLHQMRRKLISGDQTNVEAQAARYYWPRLMGADFRRDVDLDDANKLLNYGYTVLRATAARAVLAAGLHPSIGLFHANRSNAFALADDLMEPFRPLVDCCVRQWVQRHGSQVTPDAKQALAQLIALDLPLGDGLSPVSIAVQKLAVCQRRSKNGPGGGAKLGHFWLARDAGDGRRPVSRALHIAGG